MPFVRLTLEDGQEPDFPFVLDVLVDEAGRIAGHLSFVGWVGKPRTTQCWPFIYRQNGKGVWGLDFGSGPTDDQDERIYPFDIQSLEMRRGATVDFYNFAEDEDLPEVLHLSLRSAADLANKSDILPN